MLASRNVGGFLRLLIESFRFKDGDDYEYEIFSKLLIQRNDLFDIKDFVKN